MARFRSPFTTSHTTALRRAREVEISARRNPVIGTAGHLTDYALMHSRVR